MSGQQQKNQKLAEHEDASSLIQVVPDVIKYAQFQPIVEHEGGLTKQILCFALGLAFYVPFFIGALCRRKVDEMGPIERIFRKVNRILSIVLLVVLVIYLIVIIAIRIGDEVHYYHDDDDFHRRQWHHHGYKFSE